ncbi:class I SAM-dependent methyltransferase [Silvimonas iriomotensis]|uniref:Methyltransferase n=1 Tax=Silvimonas iriomotensis TaxID=449662 RepID=A0ABQ2P685_9NEIS|nr:class I SAM-dependent methyltransferase [Silvimonas iriomotensis]GGP19279.1 methyltransferase [Silvimonas iriomotensis]
MPQNIYDNPVFFEGYKALRQNDTGLNGAVEIPALQGLLPAQAGLRVLDLGCGFGDFARYVRSQGAMAVTGVDVSLNMLEEARRLTVDAAIRYHHGAIEDFQPDQGETFDLVVSSLALHYVADYAAAVQAVWRALRPGGLFVFSVEHPVCTANPVGWVKDEHEGKAHWPLDHYQAEGRRDTRWFVDGVIKYHRTTQTWINTLLERGFALERMLEPGPVPHALTLRPALADENRRPPFLLLRARRSG